MSKTPQLPEGETPKFSGYPSRIIVRLDAETHRELMEYMQANRIKLSPAVRQLLIKALKPVA